WLRSARVVAGTISPLRTCLVLVSRPLGAAAGRVRTEYFFPGLPPGGHGGPVSSGKKCSASLGGARQQVTCGTGGTWLRLFSHGRSRTAPTISPPGSGHKGSLTATARTCE